MYKLCPCGCGNVIKPGAGRKDRVFFCSACKSRAFRNKKKPSQKKYITMKGNKPLNQDEQYNNLLILIERSKLIDSKEKNGKIRQNAQK